MPPYRAVSEVIYQKDAPEVIPGVSTTAVAHEALWEGDEPPTIAELERIAYVVFTPDLTTGEVPAIDHKKLDVSVDPDAPAARRRSLLIQEQEKKTARWRTVASIGLNILLPNED